VTATESALDPALARLAMVVRDAPVPMERTPIDTLRARTVEGDRTQRPGPELAVVDDIELATAVGPVPVRRYIPDGFVGDLCIVYMHGGGWSTGGLGYADEICRMVADRANAMVVSVDYRLSPEHPHPAALDDAYAVLEWVAEHVTPRVVVAGDSAGGNLAAACSVRAGRRGGPSIEAQCLLYPVLDHTTDRDSYRELGQEHLLTTAAMQWLWDQYCPDLDRRNDPEVSPLHTSRPQEFPRTFVVTAGFDPLRDEALAFVQLLREVGVEVSASNYQSMTHGFLRYTSLSPGAAAAAEDVAVKIARLLDRD
jgi:acetyl esterase